MAITWYGWPPLIASSEVSPGILSCLDLDEESPLPLDLKKGNIPYDMCKGMERGA